MRRRPRRLAERLDNSGISVWDSMAPLRVVRRFKCLFLLELVRSEGLEPPRCYSLPPQGSASTNSATSAEDRTEAGARPDQRRRCNKSVMGGQGPARRSSRLEYPEELNRQSRNDTGNRDFACSLDPSTHFIQAPSGQDARASSPAGKTYLRSGVRGNICLTSTAIRLRSTSTTPLATGRLLARILTSSARWHPAR